MQRRPEIILFTGSGLTPQAYDQADIEIIDRLIPEFGSLDSFKERFTDAATSLLSTAAHGWC